MKVGTVLEEILNMSSTKMEFLKKKRTKAVNNHKMSNRLDGSYNTPSTNSIHIDVSTPPS